MGQLSTYMIKKQECERKRRSIVKRLNAYKIASFSFMITSVLLSLTFMFALNVKQTQLRDDINKLAKNIGYVDDVNLDLFMRYNQDVSKDEYVRYVDLLNKLKDTKRLQMYNIGTGIIAATTGYAMAVEAEKKAKYYSNEDVENLL